LLPDEQIYDNSAAVAEGDLAPRDWNDPWWAIDWVRTCTQCLTQDIEAQHKAYDAHRTTVMDHEDRKGFPADDSIPIGTPVSGWNSFLFLWRIVFGSDDGLHMFTFAHSRAGSERWVQYSNRTNAHHVLVDPEHHHWCPTRETGDFMRQVEAALGRTFSNMTDDTAECLLQLPKTRAYLAGQEHRAHNRRAEVEFNMLPEWPRVVSVFCEMLALMADVRMGLIRVPP